LELAAQHAGAASVGWFRVTSEMHLEPVCVVPPGGALAALIGEATTQLVAREGNAVWLTSSREPAAGHDATPEIACLPIMERERVHAALVASATPGSMRSADFDFLVALASLASAACSGHAEAPASDLASLPTVGIDSLSTL
jgi:hypothetical protein